MVQRYRGLMILLALILAANIGIQQLDVFTFSAENLQKYGDLRFQKAYHFQPDFRLKAHQIQLASPQEPKVIHLGNSTVWGAYVATEETASSHLDRYFQGKNGVRVYNFGYPGAWAEQQTFYFNEALKFEPQVIIWGLSPVDFINLEYVLRKDADYKKAFQQVAYSNSFWGAWRNLNYLTEHNQKLVLVNLVGNLIPLYKYGSVYQHYWEEEFYQHFLPLLRDLGYADRPAYEPAPAGFMPPAVPQITYQEYSLTSNNFQAIDYILEEADKQKIPLVLYLEPHVYLEQIFESGLYAESVARIQQQIERHGHTLVTFPELENPEYFVDWDHLNPQGHVLLAEKLVPHVQAKLTVHSLRVPSGKLK